MTDKDTETATKAAEVAPYMITKKNDNPETSNHNGVVIPLILALVLAVVIVASFFEGEYKALIANLSIGSDSASVSEETIATAETDTIAETTIIEETANVAAAPSPATGAKTMASSQEATQPGLTTINNPYLRPYPQVYAPVPAQAGPYGYSNQGPYSRPPQQAQGYNEMMQQRQKMMNDRHKIHNAAIQRMKKDRRDMQTKMEQRYAEFLKDRAERLRKIQQAQQAKRI